MLAVDQIHVVITFCFFLDDDILLWTWKSLLSFFSSSVIVWTTWKLEKWIRDWAYTAFAE